MGTPAPLRRPSTYVHLYRDLDTSASTFHPIVNIPKVTMRMRTDDPERRMSEDARHVQLGASQTYYPDDRHVVVSPNVRLSPLHNVPTDRRCPQTSTIIQFRHLDYGMERCVLNASLPGSSAQFDPAIALADPAAVDVWLLEGPSTELTPANGTAWTRAPRRTSTKLAELAFSRAGAESSSGEFACLSGGFTTVELACAPRASGVPCLVDFWQDPERAPGGTSCMGTDAGGVRSDGERSGQVW